MGILKEVVELSYTDVFTLCLMCVTVGIMLAMIIEEFKK